MALTLSKLTRTKKQILAIAGGVVIVSAPVWFGWQYVEEAGAAPAAPNKTQPITATNPPAAGIAAAPADAGPAQAAEPIRRLASKRASRMAKPVRSKVDADARACLDLATNNAIIRCAEKYL
jgi:hypothetical protein